VGVNDFVDPTEGPIDILVIPPETEARQVRKVRQLRDSRDGSRTRSFLERLRAGASGQENLIPLLVDCARASCTEGEIVGALREVFGEYTEDPRF
jgi:methylmalonyl-CoA mutase N-terminal domain/subunit